MTAWVLTTVGQAKRLIIRVAGFTILSIGVAMIVLPGPAIIVMPIGLAILATEFAWAARLLQTIRNRCRKMRDGCNEHEASKPVEQNQKTQEE